MLKMHCLWRGWWIIIVGLLLGCGVDPTILRPPPSFRVPDLIGNWTIIGDVYNTQTMIIRPDYTFTQQYHRKGTTEPTITVNGTWRVESRPSGCVYVHFQGMHYIYNTAYIEMHGNRLPDGGLMSFHDLCEDVTFTMPDEVILSVSSDPKAARGIFLFFPWYSADRISISMELDLPHPTAVPATP